MTPSKRTRSKMRRIMVQQGLYGWTLSFKRIQDEALYGVTDFEEYEIIIDVKLHQGDSKEIWRTFIHEVAHAVVGLVNHSKAWENKYKSLLQKYKYVV